MTIGPIWASVPLIIAHTLTKTAKTFLPMPIFPPKKRPCLLVRPTMPDKTPEELAIAEAARALGQKGGSSKSDAKRTASKENGKKGGRPKKGEGGRRKINFSPCNKKSRCVRCHTGYICEAIHVSGKHEPGLCPSCTRELMRLINNPSMTYKTKTEIARAFKAGKLIPTTPNKKEE